MKIDRKGDILRYDLHVHSDFSDGQYSPEKLIQLALERDLDGIAITDHDNISGIPVANKFISENKISNFELIPGIEFGTTYLNDEVHILGYFIDYNNKDLISVINNLNKWRESRTLKILEKIKRIGMDINEEDLILASNNNFTGRVPIAKALVEKGYVKDISEAFEKYIGIGKPCYVAKDNYSIKEIINIIQKASGVAILAHPILLYNEKTIDYVRSCGIDGIESTHSKYDKKSNLEFEEYADEHKILTTGGSDCHGRPIDGELLLGEYITTNLELERMREVHYGRR